MALNGLIPVHPGDNCQKMYFGWLWLLEFYLEHRHTPKMEHFARMGRSEKPLTIFARCSILDVWLVSEYISGY